MEGQAAVGLGAGAERREVQNPASARRGQPGAAYVGRAPSRRAKSARAGLRGEASSAVPGIPFGYTSPTFLATSRRLSSSLMQTG
jgi:hypothetical protein